MKTNLVYSQMIEHVGFSILEMCICVLLRCCAKLVSENVLN